MQIDAKKAEQQQLIQDKALLDQKNREQNQEIQWLNGDNKTLRNQIGKLKKQFGDLEQQ